MSKAHDLTAVLEQFLETAANSKRLRAKAAIEAKLEKAMAATFRRQGKWFVKALKKADSRFQEAMEIDSFDAIWNGEPTAIRQAFIRSIQNATQEALLLGGAGLIDDIRKTMTFESAISFDLKNPRAVAWLKGRAAERVTMIDETTKNTVAGIVNQGIKSGTSYNDIARQLIEKFDHFAIGKPQEHIDSRAHLIAVTEVGEAYAEGNLQAGQELQSAGIAMEKAWSTSADERVSDGCRDNAAVGWIPINDAFPSGHQRPLRFPGCRCDILMRRKKEIPNGKKAN